MFAPSAIQRADDLVGIDMPTENSFAGAAAALVGAAAAGAVLPLAGAAAGAVPQLLSNTASIVKTASRSDAEILFMMFPFAIGAYYGYQPGITVCIQNRPFYIQNFKEA